MIWLAVFVALMLHGVDWLQTRWISVRGAEYGIFETNIVLGKRPSLSLVNAWFVSWSAGLVVLLFTAPPGWSCAAFLIVALVERHYIISNQRLGVGNYGFKE